MNIIKFPVCQFIKGRHWFGGRGFKTIEDVVDSMSDRDWRRIVQWESRHAARLDAQTEKQA